MTEEQPKKRNEAVRRWQAANPEKYHAYRRRYIAEHREQLREYSREYRRKHPKPICLEVTTPEQRKERRLEAERLYRAYHSEKKLAKDRRYRERNRERLRERARETQKLWLKSPKGQEYLRRRTEAQKEKRSRNIIARPRLTEEERRERNRQYARDYYAKKHPNPKPRLTDDERLEQLRVARRRRRIKEVVAVQYLRSVGLLGPGTRTTKDVRRRSALAYVRQAGLLPPP